MQDAYFTSSHTPPEPHLPQGWKLKAFQNLDSTNSALRRLVEQGAELDEGLLIWAESQSEGRGRSGRTWVSPPGNVYASFLIAAPREKSAAPQCGFVAAVAVADTILDLPRHNSAPPQVTCKWPNDVLVDDGKVAGILPELTQGPDGTPWIILGIGINLIAVDVERALYPATALSAHHIDTTPAHVLTVLSRALHFWLDRWRTEGFAPVREAWLKFGPRTGTTVTIDLGREKVSGTFSGLDDEGALLLATSGGQRRILAGDVLFQGPA